MTQKKTKIYHVQNRTNYSYWIDDRELVKDRAEADIILFEGGEDIHPSLYGDKMGKHTYSNLQRDLYEKEIFDKYPDKFKLGICRGSQLLCTLNGGKMIQHVTNHLCVHDIKINSDNSTIKMQCTHHQMVYPFELPQENYVIIAQSLTPRSTTYLNGDNEEYENIPAEPEIVYYPKTRSLGVQGHPEMMGNKETHDYLNKLIKQYL